MLNPILLIVPIFFFSVSISAQSFEGEIKYEHSYEGHIIIAEAFIKENKCKTQRYVDGIRLSTHSLSLGRDWYSISGAQELIKKNKYKTVNEQIKLIKGKKKGLILGYTCTVYKEKRDTPYGKDIMIYYLADSLKAYNQNGLQYIRNGRIVLKRIQKTERGIYEDEAIEIKEMKLDDKLFELPDYPIIEVDFEKLSKQYIKEAGH